MREIETANTYEVQIRNGLKVIAHMSCSLINEEIYIRDLYVLRHYRGKGLGEVLLTKVLDYATENNAKQIISYCGTILQGWSSPHGTRSVLVQRPRV